MIKNTEAQRRHTIYLRAKNALRDQHQDNYALMLERHAQELDTLWSNYNLAVKKLAREHNKTVKSRGLKSTALKSKIVPIGKKRVLNVEPEEKVMY